MNPQTFFFTGRSGSGKGTQAQLLIQTLKQSDPGHPVLYVQTGAELRQFIQGDTYTQKICKELYDSGGLQPEFIAVYQWVKVLVEKYTGREHIIFDGTPRRLHEAGVTTSILDYYKLDKPWVFNIEISDEEAVKRLLARKRMDDSEEDIRVRLYWYETEVVPVVEYFKNNNNFRFANIDGMRSVETIHQEIVSKLGL